MSPVPHHSSRSTPAGLVATAYFLTWMALCLPLLAMAVSTLNRRLPANLSDCGLVIARLGFTLPFAELLMFGSLFLAGLPARALARRARGSEVPGKWMVTGYQPQYAKWLLLSVYLWAAMLVVPTLYVWLSQLPAAPPFAAALLALLVASNIIWLASLFTSASQAGVLEASSTGLRFQRWGRPRAVRLLQLNGERLHMEVDGPLPRLSSALATSWIAIEPAQGLVAHLHKKATGPGL